MVITSCLKLSSNIFKQDFKDLHKTVKSLTSLSKNGSDSFTSNALLQGRMHLDPIYGGQNLALQLRAACMTVSTGMLPHSTHSYFLDSGTVNQPLHLNVKRIRDGKSFCSRYVESHQGNKVLCSGFTSFHVEEKPAIKHLEPFRVDVNPDTLPTWRDGILEALEDNSITPFHRKLLQWKLKNTPHLFLDLFDIRTTDVPRWTMRTRHPPHRGPTHKVFMRSKYSPGDSQIDHRVMGAFMGDIVMIEGALMDHINAGFFPTMLFSLDQCLYFHTDVNTNEWMYVEVKSPIAENGRIYAECKFWSTEGQLMMTSSQEGLARYDENHPNSQAPK
ncbi:unnamed protein product [Bursaphelenchus xylophilus]|uniref:(pine wood nematode) hypothetical protein n=1 Tax=Bursaphelenchus xylophilus TaxID=6326 RepID=A0A1I7STD1_BURXY|nr:unnamed protein product [Bursaphelenchus xylophilus]CAG9108554.1 unnamed protein product [Bursaphelenchus xylophilus]